MYWVRVDNRLVHGQIIETWLPFTKSRMIVVANDELSDDTLRQEIMGLAIPAHVETAFVCVTDAGTFLKSAFSSHEPDVLVLFASCTDARRAHEAGLSFPTLNLGNLHYGPGKDQLCPHVALDDHDRSCLRYFDTSGVDLDFRCVPNEPVQVNGKW